MLDLSLVYLVLTAIDLGVMIHWGPVSVAPTVTRPMISWIGPVILMTAAIVSLIWGVADDALKDLFKDAITKAKTPTNS